MTHMIHVTQLSKTFGPVKALRNVDLTIHQGEFVAMVGPSGSGKSTLLRVLGLLEDFEEGDYVLDGKSVRQLGDPAKAMLRNRLFGFVFQSYELIETHTALANVLVPAFYRDRIGRTEEIRALALLDRVGLGDRTHHRPSQLSGGEQQRVSIARALMNQPKILLADEPTGNLDSQTAEIIIQLLTEINRDSTTVILVTHNLDIARLSHRQIALKDGEYALAKST